jgi:hypothetical protein
VTPSTCPDCRRPVATPRLPVVYLAHPVGAPTVEGVLANLAAARRWLWALRTASTWSIAAPWIGAVQAALEAGTSEAEERARGLVDMLAQVERCDGIVLVGGRVSAGMALERDHAIKHGLAVVDLTGLGEEPAAGLGDRLALWSLDRRLGGEGR